MNKRTLILTILYVIGLGAWAPAVTLATKPVAYELSNVPNGYEQIVLCGELMLGVGPNAIEAGASDDTVYIQFNQNFGNVSITIYNSSNLVVYSTVVDTSIQQVVIIPFANALADSYSVVLSRANSYAEGDFEKN